MDIDTRRCKGHAFRNMGWVFVTARVHHHTAIRRQELQNLASHGAAATSINEIEHNSNMITPCPHGMTLDCPSKLPAIGWGDGWWRRNLAHFSARRLAGTRDGLLAPALLSSS